MRQLHVEDKQQFKHVCKEYILADGGTKNLDLISRQELKKYLLTSVSA